MADQEYTFTQAKQRLEEIVVQVRSKDMTLEKSLDLLEEGVRLANMCTELSDHTEWQAVLEGEKSDASEQPSEDEHAADAGSSDSESPEDAEEFSDDEKDSGHQEGGRLTSDEQATTVEEDPGDDIREEDTDT